MHKIKIEGIKELERALKQNATLDDVRKVVRHNGVQLHDKATNNADFKGGYSTGETKRSITLTIENGGMTAEVEPQTHYAPYVEYGTRFMGAQPFMRPALEKQKNKFLSDMKKLCK